jgi:hypothetical protein
MSVLHQPFPMETHRPAWTRQVSLTKISKSQASQNGVPMDNNQEMQYILSQKHDYGTFVERSSTLISHLKRAVYCNRQSGLVVINFGKQNSEPLGNY